MAETEQIETAVVVIDAAIDRIWQAALAQLEGSMSVPTFHAWVRSCRLVSLESQSAVLACPTATGRELLASRHLGQLESVLTTVAGRRIRVELTVDEGLLADPAPTYEDPPTLVEVEVVRPPKADAFAVARGRIENNLSRKAVFALQGRRIVGPGRETVTDVVGTVTRTYTLGQLGALEMDITVWLMGQWTPRSGGRVTFRLRELARGLGTAWNGDFGIAAKDAIRRMKEMTITGKVYDAGTRRYREHGFSLIDDYVLDERREAIDVEGTRSGSLSVQLGAWLVRQLEAGQFAEIQMAIYRSAALRAPKARRLFQFLECEEGEDDGCLVRVPVNEALGETLGTNDARQNPSRFRSDLVGYGKAICAATDGMYESVALRAVPAGYELHVRRRRAWRRQREEARRRFLARYPRAV